LSYPRTYPTNDGTALGPADYNAIVNALSGLTLEGYLQYPFSFIVRKNGSYYEVISETGQLAYGGSEDAGDISGTNFHDVMQAGVDAVEAAGGGRISLTQDEFEIDDHVEITGGGPTPPTITVCITGAGRFATIIKATANFDDEGTDPNGPFIVNNGASVVLEHFYINMNSQNGNGLVGRDTGETWDRSFQKSYIHDIEIRGVTGSYWCIYAINPYITNTWDNLYLRTGGGGIQMICNATGYGNQHFGNVVISLSGNNKIGVRFYRDGNAFSLNTWMRLHIDGGNTGSPAATGNLGIELDGSNYNTFVYVEIENIKYCVKMGTSQSTHGNTILSGYTYISETDGKTFQVTVNAKRNKIQNVYCAAASGKNVQLIDDDNTDIDAPNIYQDLHGPSTGFLGVGSYITRADVNAARLHGQMLWRKAQNGISTEFYISPTGIRELTVTHGLCDTPALESCTIGLIQSSDVDDWDAYVIDMRDATTTTVKVRINVVVKSATALSTAYLAFHGDVNG
jgi:hypothetical protein